MVELRDDYIQTGTFSNVIDNKVVDFIAANEDHALWSLDSRVMIKKFADELKKELNGGSICK